MTSALIHGMFENPQTQLRNVAQWNKEFGLDLSAEEFVKAEDSIPTWPNKKFGALVLVPYLADGVCPNSPLEKTSISGLVRTFRFLLGRAAAGQNASLQEVQQRYYDEEYLRLARGIEHRTGLFWEVIDLCNVDDLFRERLNPTDEIPEEYAVHAGVLAAAAHHPEWVRSISNGVFVSRPVLLSGYIVEVDGFPPLTPVLSVKDKKIRLVTVLMSAYHGAAVPKILKK